MKRPSNLWPGILLAAVIAVPALFAVAGVPVIFDSLYDLNGQRLVSGTLQFPPGVKAADTPAPAPAPAPQPAPNPGTDPTIGPAPGPAPGPSDPKPSTGPSFPANVPMLIWVGLGLAGAFVIITIVARRRQQSGGFTGGSNQFPPRRSSNGGVDPNFTRTQAPVQPPKQPDSPEIPRKTFKDVAGCDEAIAKLKRVVRWMKAPGWFAVFGAKIPKGAMLVGPPGTGKTLLAKAVAGEAGASFIAISGSQFVEMYVGVGAARVRDLFRSARAERDRTKKPVIIFIDEIDAVGKQRGGQGNAAHDERDQTLNQILVEMDGFAPNSGIFVLAATNREDILDAALKRPGRFDYRVYVDLPDREGRELIFGIHTRDKPLGPDASLRHLATRTPGYSGADIEAVCNEAATIAAERVEAAVHAARAKKASEDDVAKIPKFITLHDFDEAVDIIAMGDARASRARTMSREQMAQTAYHEVGHAAVVHVRKGDPVSKITIVPRARALGYTQSLPEGDRYNMTHEDLLTRIMMAMGGRVAQEVFLNTVDTGAQNDFQQASKIAKRMVTEFGMSPLGNMFVPDSNPCGIPEVGPELSNAIDREWKKILNDCYAEARKIIEGNKDRIEHVVAALMEKETLLGDEFRALWNAAPVAVAVPVDETPPPPPSSSEPAAS